MSITDELREWISTVVWLDDSVQHTHEKVLAIADRIDAEHERLMQEQPFTIDMVPMTDERMAEHGWIRLPKDANGVPICVGDVLTDGEHTFVVDELAAFGGGSWSIRNEDENAWKACDVTHYHEPTVEDVLRDVVTLCHNTWKEESPFHFYDVDDVMKSGNIAEYAAKLRLAKDGE